MKLIREIDKKKYRENLCYCVVTIKCLSSRPPSRVISDTTTIRVYDRTGMTITNGIMRHHLGVSFKKSKAFFPRCSFCKILSKFVKLYCFPFVFMFETRN